jgi:hypothetical protein
MKARAIVDDHIEILVISSDISITGQVLLLQKLNQ